MHKQFAIGLLVALLPTWVSAQSTTPVQKLSSFLMEENRILHGYGMDMFRWHTDAVPYIAASTNRPAIYGSYIRLTEVRDRDQDRLTQLTRMHDGWTDPTTGLQTPLVPLIGIQAWTYDFNERLDTLAAAFFEVLGITDEAMAQFGLEQPTYGMSLFADFLAHPQLWESVRDTLVTRGLHTQDIDLPALVSAGTEEAEFRLIALRDSALVLAADRLVDRGFQFHDLAVLDGMFDDEIREIADSIKQVPSPYLVRFMYESVEGISRPVLYSAETFKSAYRHVVDLFREQGATNAEFIYHPNTGNAFNLDAWYPGDAYVDWISPSIFHSLHGDFERDRMQDQHDFAARHDVPVIIAESAPTSDRYTPHNTSYPGVWEDWFEPFFEFMKQSTHVRAFVYIGVDWGRLSGDFNDWGDTRVIVNPELFARWEAELANPVYLHNREFWTAWTQRATDVDAVPDRAPLGLAIWPNPSTTDVTIERTVTGQRATIAVYDVTGRAIFQESMSPGQRYLMWDGRTTSGRRSAPGLYLVQIQSPSGEATRTIVRY